MAGGGALVSTENMNVNGVIAAEPGETGSVGSLAALAEISFPSLNPMEILATAAYGAEALCVCRVEASYCSVDETMTLCPSSQSERPELTDILRRSSWKGEVSLRQGDWGRAFPLSHRDVVHGCLVVGAADAPTSNILLLLEVLAQRAGAALACADLHQRNVRRARQLEESNDHLSSIVSAAGDSDACP